MLLPFFRLEKPFFFFISDNFLKKNKRTNTIAQGHTPGDKPLLREAGKGRNKKQKELRFQDGLREAPHTKEQSILLGGVKVAQRVYS